MIVVRLARATAALAHELGGEGGLSASPTGGYTYIYIYIYIACALGLASVARGAQRPLDLTLEALPLAGTCLRAKQHCGISPC